MVFPGSWSAYSRLRLEAAEGWGPRFGSQRSHVFMTQLLRTNHTGRPASTPAHRHRATHITHLVAAVWHSIRHKHELETQINIALAHHGTAQHTRMARAWLRMWHASARPLAVVPLPTTRPAGLLDPKLRAGQRRGRGTLHVGVTPQLPPLPPQLSSPCPWGCTRAGGASLGMGYPEDWARLRQDCRF